MPLQVPAPSAQDVCFHDLGRDSAAKTRAEPNSVPIYRVLEAGWRGSIYAHPFPHFWGVIAVQMKQSRYCIGELRRRRPPVEV